MFEVNKSPSVRDLRRFGQAMLFGFGVIAVVLWAAPAIARGEAEGLAWAGTGSQLTALVLAGLGIVLCVLSYGSPKAARPVYVSWMTVGMAIGTVVTTVLLTTLYLVLLPVFSLIVRKGDPLRKRLQAKGTYWEEYRAHEPTIERMRRPF